MEYILQELSYDEEKELANRLGLTRVETHAILQPTDEYFYSLERQDYVAVTIIANTVNNINVMVSMDTLDARRLLTTIKSDLRQGETGEYVLWKQLILYMMTDIYASFKEKK